MFVGEHDCGGAITKAKFGEDATDMCFDGQARDVEFIGEFGVGVAFGDQCEHVFFPSGELGEREVGGWAANSRVDQCVALVGVVSSVAVITASTCSSDTVRGRPGRGSSSRPSSRVLTNRFRHLRALVI
jgi:hypothetical protein